MSNTGGFNPIAGIGVTPMFRDPGDKRFTSEEVKLALIQKIQDEPEIVRNQFNIVTKEQSGEMQQTFWPALLDPDQWTRLSTHRPDKDENGEPLNGTNREVREYENEFWMDNRKHMVAKVTTEFGNIISFDIVARW